MAMGEYMLFHREESFGGIFIVTRAIALLVSQDSERAYPL
jgi:hypothetical protein